jgi:hypothetical protein
MTPTQISALIRLYTGTNSTSFTDADILVLANPLKDEIAGEIVEVHEDYFDREFLTNLVAGQRQYGLPDEILNKIKYIEAKLDGTTQKRLNEFDLNSYQKATDEATIVAQFSGKNPMVDIDGTSIFIYSDAAIISVVGGLIIKAAIFPTDISSLSATIDLSVDPDEYKCGFPRQFHELLARRISMLWKSNRPKPVALSEVEKLYYVDLAKKIEALKGRNLDRSVEASVPNDNGQDY